MASTTATGQSDWTLSCCSSYGAGIGQQPVLAAGIRNSSSGDSASNPPALLHSPLGFLHQQGKFICAVGEHSRGEAAGSGCAVLDLAEIQLCK